MQLRNWGAIASDGMWSIATWAPDAQAVTLDVGDRTYSCRRDENGYWHAEIRATQGTTYTFTIDGVTIPDPAARLQFGDVHGPSVLLEHNPQRARVDWTGRDWAEAVIYELHIGTFTPEGNFAAAGEKLSELASMGITAIELMPIGQFSGTRGWGYDGVLPFAPHPSYGTPDDVKAFVDRAHALGLMVILDVVMNHFGPDGAYLHQSAPAFFNPERHTPWGAAIDFSKPPVRAYWIECALMWLRDYGMDGLRLDAVHQITGPGADDFFAELARAVGALDLGRPLHLITEDERNDPQLRETHGYTATWNDDFHHAIHTALTGEDQDYYASFSHDPIGDLARALERGHIEEGQNRKGRDEPRGKPAAHLPATSFVNATQTHDQVGNRAFGDRLLALADPQAVESAYALLLVSPYIPMIFMGEERGETTPFLFFADYQGDLGQMVREGRAAEFPRFAEHGDTIPDPTAAETYFSSRLDWTDTEHARQWRSLTRRALTFRSNHVVALIKSARQAVSVTRAGDKSIAAHWSFAAGDLDIHLNLGEVGTFDAPLEDAQFRLRSLAADRYAIAARVRPI